MRTVPLGRRDTITEIMLGTMTYGSQTGEADAHAQLDMAADAGVTWLDTAEVYPVNPVRAETVGRTEEIVGRWLARNPGRLRVATKQSSKGSAARDGEAITPETLPKAVEGSLRRLQIEVIDLYQFHSPNRGGYMFRRNWDYRPEHDRGAILQNLGDCVGALEREIERGTIRAFGPSNETAWGLTQFCRLAGDGPARPVSIQNEYSMIARIADTDLTEVMVQEEVTMLAYSPLGAGILTGKYQDGAVPQGSRKSINDTMGGRWTDRVEPTVDAYLTLAREAGIDPVHMALAWLRSRPFACAAILGATTADQLAHGLKAQDVTLSDDLVAAIDTTHKAHPMPY